MFLICSLNLIEILNLNFLEEECWNWKKMKLYKRIEQKFDRKNVLNY